MVTQKMLEKLRKDKKKIIGGILNKQDGIIKQVMEQNKQEIEVGSQDY